MLFLDVFLYKLACLIWPDDKQKPAASVGNSEDSANWIILEDLESDGKLSDTAQNDDPFLTEEYDDGPEW